GPLVGGEALQAARALAPTPRLNAFLGVALVDHLRVTGGAKGAFHRRWPPGECMSGRRRPSRNRSASIRGGAWYAVGKTRDSGRGARAARAATGAAEMETPVRIVPLGGVGEVGKNATLIELGDDMLLVDAGVKFPEAELHGVDLVIPDFTYVQERADHLLAVLFTHGHEDHIGALPYLLMGLEDGRKLPIYGSPLTLGLIGVKLREHGLVDQVEPVALPAGQQTQLGPFLVEAVGVNHSIPDALAFAIHTPYGIVVHTGDFKFDPTPVEGKTTDVEALRALGDEGVLLLLSDCVRVEQGGWTPSERLVYDTLNKILAEAPGRVIITSFASNIGRLRDVASSAHKLGRRTAVAGRSMDENLRVARSLGYFNVPDDAVVELRQAQSLPPHKVALLTTGSQGEPTSVLSRMAAGEHPHVKILPEDTVVFSASPVP